MRDEPPVPQPSAVPQPPDVTREQHGWRTRCRVLPARHLVGRHHDLQTLLLTVRHRDAQIVTLYGPAGAGKTALALAAVAEPVVASTFPDGVYVVDLTLLQSPAGVPVALSTVLGLEESATPHAHVIDYLRHQQVLLVLDNFEHLLDAGRAVADVVAACPRVTVLATSRVPLRLRGEHVVPVRPLPVPACPMDADLAVLSACPAVELFRQRADAAAPDVSWTLEIARTVASICALLDGLPLAIELAAARVRHLSPHAILAHLGGDTAKAGDGVDDVGVDGVPGAPGTSALDLLVGGAGDLPARHQSLQRALDWSVELLAPTERRFLRRMAVFAESFPISAAAAVASTNRRPGSGPPSTVGHDAAAAPGHMRPTGRPAPVDTRMDGAAGRAADAAAALHRLTALVEASLVQRVGPLPGAPDTESRYRLLATVRAYAMADLQASGEADEAQQRHAAHYLAVAEHTVPQLQGQHHAASLLRLEREHSNLRAALAWSRSWATRDAPLDGGTAAVAALDVGLRLVGALWWFWYRASFLAEGRRWIESVVAAAGAVAAASPGWEPADAVLANALCGAGALARRQGDYLAARAHLERALHLARRSGAAQVGAYARGLLGLTCGNEGDHRAGAALLQEAIQELRMVGDAWGVAFLQNPLGRYGLRAGDPQALQVLEASALTFRRCGDAWGLSLSLEGLAEAALSRGHVAAAQALADESLVLARQVRDRWMILTALTCGGVIARAQGELARAVPLLQEALVVAREADARGKAGECLAHLGAVAAAAGQPAVGARLLSAAQAQREVLGGLPVRFDPESFASDVAAVRQQLGERAFEAAWARGTTMPIGQAVDLALTLELSEPAPPGLGTRPAQPSAGPAPPPWSAAARAAGLTPREWEVLSLLAGGASTRAIAAALCISPHTAVRHAASVLGKLGVSTRGEAVATALGLTDATTRQPPGTAARDSQ